MNNQNEPLNKLREEYVKFWHDLFGGEYDNTDPQGRIWDWFESHLKAQKDQLIQKLRWELVREKGNESYPIEDWETITIKEVDKAISLLSHPQQDHKEEK